MEATPTTKSLQAIGIGLMPETTLHIMEGTARSSKTITAIEEFYQAVQRSTEQLHLIACADLDAIRENILNCTFGLCERHPTTCQLVKDKIGSVYLRVLCIYPNRPKIKNVLLVGYTNIDKWKKILGKTLGVILIDEVNTASKNFVDECFARQVSVDEPLQIWTLNGDQPNHWIYQDYINKAVIYGKAPASIHVEMDSVEKTKGWVYQHWTMNDNPIMTEEKIERAMSIYPKGSYYYITKILGERGAMGELIYQEYLSPDLIQDIELTDYSEFIIGVDIGQDRAKNSFCLCGFTRDYTKVAVIDLDCFDCVGYVEKTERLKAFVYKWLSKIPINLICVDSAEQNYIHDLASDFRKNNLPTIIGSYKATIKQRIDMDIVLMAKKKFIFNSTESAKMVYRAFQCAKWEDGKIGEVRQDNNEWLNDVIDSCEYAMTRHMKALLKSAE